MHITPDMTFETIQMLAHNLGISLRQTIQQSSPKVTPPQYPSGIKALFTHSGSVHAVDSETEGAYERLFSQYQASLEEVEVAIASARAGLTPTVNCQPTLLADVDVSLSLAKRRLYP
jgi:hypothetical protein